MPLNEKGKKIMKAMKKQYGVKEGEKVFYAMENSGKLKKVIKARGGDAARAAKARGNMEGRVTPGAVDRSAVGPKSQFQRNILKKQRKDLQALISPSTTTKNKIIGTMIGLVVPGGNFMYKTAVDQNTIFAPKRKKTLLPTDRPDDRGPSPSQNNQPNVIKPIEAQKPIDPLLIKPKDNFFNFVAYNSGGVSSGPPPKRGPNPQVPPVKMKSGKMSKMSCPHRPDGIRGMGAAIKGSKFVGVK